MVESMLGLNTLTSVIEIRKLMFLHKILSLPPTSTAKELFTRKYCMFTIDRSSVTLGYIPDICKIIAKYNLQFMLNDFISGQQTLPTKARWKNIVSCAIKTREAELWDNRVTSDPDFVLYKVLQPNIVPAVVYRVCQESYFRKTMYTVANLWSRSVKLDNHTCDFCDKTYQDNIVHIVCECAMTDILRVELVYNMERQFGRNFTRMFAEECSDAFTKTLRMMGAPLEPVLEESANLKLLKITFTHICKCLRSRIG